MWDIYPFQDEYMPFNGLRIGLKPEEQETQFGILGQDTRCVVLFPTNHLHVSPNGRCRFIALLAAFRCQHHQLLDCQPNNIVAAVPHRHVDVVKVSAACKAFRHISIFSTVTPFTKQPREYQVETLLGNLVQEGRKAYSSYGTETG